MRAYSFMTLRRSISLWQWILSVPLLFSLGCDKIPELPSVELSGDRKIEMLVVNEGLFTTNTAALSAIYNDGTVFWDVFEPINRRPLGDVAQSITEINGKYFIAVNNSRRIEVLDSKTFKAVGSIRYEQSGSPRYITPLTDNTALVSDLYGQLVIIRTQPPYEVLEYIPLPTPKPGIEQMATSRGKVFGVYFDTGIAVFDADRIRIPDMRIIDEIKISWDFGSLKPMVDFRGRVWLAHRTQSGVRLSAIDPDSEQIVVRYDIPFAKAPAKEGDIVGMPNYNRVDIDAKGEKIFINLYRKTGTQEKLQTVYALTLRDMQLTEYLQLPNVKMMYGMAVSPKGDVCICDCLDYTAQRGYIRVYPKAGGEVKSYKVGVYPNRIFFPNNAQNYVEKD